MAGLGARNVQYECLEINVPRYGMSAYLSYARLYDTCDITRVLTDWPTRFARKTAIL